MGLTTQKEYASRPAILLKGQPKPSARLVFDLPRLPRLDPDPFEELGEKLLVLEDAQTSAERELEALKGKRDRTTELEQDRDALLDSLMQIGS